MTIEEIEDEMHILLKEAHSIGNELGYKACAKDAQASYSRSYDTGLNDAWKCFKKIAYPVKDGGFSTERLCEIFGTSLPSHIIRDFSPSEAIQKIKDYEEKQKDEIRVGDEVYIIDKNHKSVVTSIIEDYGDTSAVIIGESGRWSFVECEKLNKTGKHYPQIAEVLKELRGDKE